MASSSDRELLALTFNLFTSLHSAVFDGIHGETQVKICRGQLVQLLSGLATLSPGVARARDLLAEALPANITSEFIESLERLVFGPIATEIRHEPDVPRDRARIFDLLDRLKANIQAGDTHSAWAFRTLLLTALDQAGALSITKESDLLLERASDLLSQAYATLDSSEWVGLRAAIDAWQQDHFPFRALSSHGVTPLQTVRTLLASIPVEALTFERLLEFEGLLDGHIAVASVTPPTSPALEDTAALDR